MREKLYWHIDLDVVDFGNLEFQTWLDDHDVTAELINPEGPGGGHPVYRFYGDYYSLWLLAADVYEDVGIIRNAKMD